MDEALQARVLEARRLFREHLPEELQRQRGVLRCRTLHPAASQDNILFGKIAGQAQATERIGELITEVLDELGLHERVVEVGLQAPTGSAAAACRSRSGRSWRSPAPSCGPGLILYEATASLDLSEQQAILDALLQEFGERSLIWAVSRSDWAGSSTTCWSCAAAGWSGRDAMS